MNSRDQLIALAVKHEGNWQKICSSVQNKEFFSEEEINSYLEQVKSNVMTILDPDYPQYLREYYCPPFVLFYYGDISLILNKDNNIAVVGSREASKQGKQNTRYIVKGIAKRYNIVSGLAKGIDTVAHKTALDSGGRTIAILGNGIEYCYPSENDALYKEIRKKHLIISEYFGNLPPDSDHFYQRNRLIVMFSKGTIVGEANSRSGSMMTANLTLQYYHELMCIPSGDIQTSFCDQLIKEGCSVILSPEDVFEIFKD